MKNISKDHSLKSLNDALLVVFLECRAALVLRVTLGCNLGAVCSWEKSALGNKSKGLRGTAVPSSFLMGISVAGCERTLYSVELCEYMCISEPSRRVI